MGFVLLGLMTLNQIGVTGAVLQMFSHGIIAGLLFAIVGRIVYDRTHTRQLAELETMHLGKRLPFAAWAFVIAGMASMGLPGFSGFVAELQVLVGAWIAKPWWTIAAGVGIVIGVAYTWRALQKAFFSDTLPTAHVLEQEHNHDASICRHHLAGNHRRRHAGWRQSLRRPLSAHSSRHHRTGRKSLARGRRTMNYADLFRATLPETALEFAALFVLVVDLGFLRKVCPQSTCQRCRAIRSRWLLRGVVGDGVPVRIRTCMLASLWFLQSGGGVHALHRRESLCLTALTLLLADRLQFHASCWRVCGSGADGRSRRLDHSERAGSAGDLCWP